MRNEDTPYIGETKERYGVVASFMTVVAPGLGYQYVGKLVVGVAINLAFLFSLELFLFSWIILKFFPFLPGLVFVILWITLFYFLIRNVQKRSKQWGKKYVLTGGNHWLPYFVTATFSFLLPLGILLYLTFTSLFSFVKVNDNTMSPNLIQGDWTLVDRTYYWNTSPDRGDLVLIQNPLEADKENVILVRVIGIGGDIVQLEGETPLVNFERLRHHIYDHIKTEVISDFDTDGTLYLETNKHDDYRYLIHFRISGYPYISEPVEVDSGYFYVLADNRSQPIGSPEIGLVPREMILGKPLYVAWSENLNVEEIRPHRIGLRLQ